MKSSNDDSNLHGEVPWPGKGTETAQFAAPVRYGLAIVSVGAALGAGLFLQTFHFRVPAASLLLFAVAIASWCTGPGPAVVAVILATMSCYWFFVEPVRTIYINASEIPFFTIFTAFAVLLCWFGTVRRRIEAELRASEERFRTLVQFSFDVYWESDAEHRFTRQEFSERLADAPAPGSEIGKRRWEIPYVEPDEAAWQKHRATMVAHVPFRDFELARPTPDGGKRYVSVSGLPVFDDAGRFLGYRGVGRHITERKRAEEQLRRLNRELRAISDCNQALLRATDEPTLLKNICRIVCEEAGYHMAWVGYAEHDEAKTVRPVAWSGAEEGYLAGAGVTWADTDRGRGPTGTAIRSGTSCCIQDFAADPRVAPWRESALQRGFRSGIALPLKDEHANAFGSLTIHSAQPNAFTVEEIRLLEELAGDLAFGIVTLRSAAARNRAEEALRRTQAYLEEAQRLSHTGSWAFDVATNSYVYASEECVRIFELDTHETSWSRESVSRLIHPEEWPRVNAAYEDTIREKLDTSSEFRITLPSGTVKHVHASRHPILNDAGEVVQVVGTVMDITERKRGEEALRRSEAYLAEAQRLAHIGSWAYDHTGEPIYWSEEMFRIYAFDPQQGAPTRAQRETRIHPDDLEDVRQGRDRLLCEKVDCDFEHRIVLPDGSIRHVYVRGHPVLSPAGKVLETVGTTVDITDRKRAEAALRESETRFRTFVDHAADAFFMLDEEGLILDVNRAACESLGYTRQELLGMKPMAFHLDSDRAQIESAAEQAAAGEAVVDTHWHRRKDGALFPVEVHTSLVSYAGRRFLLKVARDITDRVRAKEQHDRLHHLEAELAHINRVSMMGELAASIAHELGQPLSAVVNNGGACLRWLARDVPNLEEAREAARRIVRDGKRAGEVIARIRALTKGTTAPTEQLDLDDTLREVLALVGDEAKRNSVTIRTQFAAALAPVVGDRVQLQQVALNLVMNAIEAMSSVEGRLRELVISTKELGPDQVQVTVEDAGTGIDPNAMDKIFDAFYTTKSGGMGMGLSISRSIIQAHGGRLWAEATDGPGTRFHFSLPSYREDVSHA